MPSRQLTTQTTFSKYRMSISTGRWTGKATNPLTASFAQFFIAPLFDPSGTDREMRAVDSEHKMNILSDSWRLYAVDRACTNPLHPLSKFGTGCLETLADKPEIRKQLAAFHERYYSANLMKLVIYGREALDQLAIWADGLFSGIPNRLAVQPLWPADLFPWTASEAKTGVYAKTIMDFNELSIKWQLPDMRRFYHTKPTEYVTHFLGHEGPGSILALLKTNGWATSLRAYCNVDAVFPFLTVSIDLSEDGLAHYSDIVCLVFSYLDLVKKHGVDLRAWNECKQIAELTFHFEEKTPSSTRTCSLAFDMHRYDSEHVLDGNCVMDRFDAPVITSVIEALKVENFRLFLATSKSSSLAETFEWQSEKWYGVEYAVKPLPDDFVKRLRDPAKVGQLKLPPPNPFLPSDLKVIHPEASKVTVV